MCRPTSPRRHSARSTTPSRRAGGCSWSSRRDAAAADAVLSAPMKVLVISNDFPPRVGGANAYVGELCRRFPAGSAVVLASACPGDESFDRWFPQRVVRHPVRTLLPTPSLLSA